jgi:hypothetical protein
MATREAELVIETWRVRERDLPRVPPTGWGSVDRLRGAVCAAVACGVDGIERVEPFEGPASEREHFAATVTAESIDDEFIHVRPASNSSDGDASSESATGGTEGFEDTTEQFDLNDALDRL